MVQVIRELFKRARGTEKRALARSSLHGGSPSSIPLENACRRKHNRPCTMDYVPNTRRNPCSSVKNGQCLRKLDEDRTNPPGFTRATARAGLSVVGGSRGRKINNLPEKRCRKTNRRATNVSPKRERKDPNPISLRRRLPSLP